MSDIEAQLRVLERAHAPALIRNGDERAQTRFWEFFVSNIRNPNTRRACGARAAVEFFDWLEARCVSRATTYRLRKDGGRQ